jgi:GTP-binding protein
VLPVVALVGRPNVGKSTLFNRLTRSRDALVADIPGLTRDRHYGDGRIGPRPYIVIDTGGFEPVANDGIVREMAAQTEQAIAESDVVVFVLDAREGLGAHDRRIAERLRVTGRRIVLAVNKAEGMRPEAVAEFHELGMGEPLPVSATHGDGVGDLMDRALAGVPEAPVDEEDGAAAGAHRVKVAVVGRPNVGKSTLVNALLGEERMIAFDQPGTTRDSIAVDFEYGAMPFRLIDTAGLRRRGRVFETIEKFSVVKALQSIADSNVVILVLDATAGVSDHDAHIAGYVLEKGRALVVAVNKWDGVDGYRRETVERELQRRLHFLGWAEVQQISALKRSGLGRLMQAVTNAHRAAFAKLPTPKLTRSLAAAVARQQPPRSGGGRPKMRYAHQGGSNPPIIVIHGSALGDVPDSYRRYLEGWFRDQFKLAGTPLRVEFRTTRNPYVD